MSRTGSARPRRRPFLWRLPTWAISAGVRAGQRASYASSSSGSSASDDGLDPDSELELTAGATSAWPEAARRRVVGMLSALVERVRGRAGREPIARRGRSPGWAQRGTQKSR